MAAAGQGGEFAPRRYWLFVCENVEPNGGSLVAERKSKQISFGGLTLKEADPARYSNTGGRRRNTGRSPELLVKY